MPATVLRAAGLIEVPHARSRSRKR